MVRECHYRRVRLIQAADEVCRGELWKSRNKQGRRGKGSRDHKTIACFGRARTRGLASEIIEAQGRGGSSDLLELEKGLACAEQARRNHITGKKARN